MSRAIPSTLLATLAAALVLLGHVRAEDARPMEAAGDASPSKVVIAAPTFGDPLPGITAEQRARFLAGKEAFETAEDVADGLGPIFNDNSCVACHNRNATGGDSDVSETRFGLLVGDAFDPLLALGGSLLQVQSIDGEGTPPGCSFPTEVVPAEANHAILRRSLPLFGAGLIDAVPDQELTFLAFMQRVFTPATAGRVSMAQNVAQGVPTPSRFGWKGQVPTLFQFSGKAYVDEMGITNPEFPLENCPNGVPDCALVRACNPAPGLNDDGEDVQLFFDFMRLLAPPPRGPITRQVIRGEAVFARIGCAACHTPTLFTGASDVRALAGRPFHPYSDLLLHDMGALGDGTSGEQGDASLVEGNATPREMRTQPLWGIRVQPRLLHDGRAATPAEAILQHDGQGASARRAYQRLAPWDRQALLAFLGSL